MATKPQYPPPEVTTPYIDYVYHEPGSLPGTLTIEADATPPTIALIDYDQTDFTSQELLQPEDCVPYLDTDTVSWVDVQGLGNEDILQRLGQVFNLHPLILEDIFNVGERPKVEDYQEQLVIIARMVIPRKTGEGFSSEQVSLVLGKHYLLTIQEEPERDCFDLVRLRIRADKGNIRKRGADYLAYALLDAMIDGFFPILEEYGERLEDLEGEVITNPTRQTMQKIYQIKRDLLTIRRAIWPQRDVINVLIRDKNEFMSNEVQMYLRDCYDHAIQILDMVETYRELSSSLMDFYLSTVSNRMNEVMKLLTVISTIFIPLTFIVGVYGMNFENMPELKWNWGYPTCLGIMITIACGLIFFFWRRGWFQTFSTLEGEENK